MKLPNFFVAPIRDLITGQLQKIESLSCRKNFVMPGYETPRRLSVVGGARILEECFPLAMVYANHSLWSVLSEITGKKLYSVTHPDEFIVANFLQHEDDTHGWHLDDPQFALIVVLAAPPPDDGGMFEYVANWVAFCERHGLHPEKNLESAVELARTSGELRRLHHAADDCFLLNAAENLHRVTPIVSHASRSALNMAFDDRPDRRYGNTATLLYGEEVHV
ncbi:hypothetical protein AQ611_21530 [Burkholderia singularis]|nr:hypothetical protein AQ611_21530 [Burkholderia sp. Bp7605]